MKFGRNRRTNFACGRLHSFRQKAPLGVFDGLRERLLKEAASPLLCNYPLTRSILRDMIYYVMGGYGMDIQLKRGLLDVCVLAAIKNQDSYGYQIIKDLKPYIELSESTLYTILKRLESANMLTVRTVEHGGRLRKYYHITPAGAKRIQEFKEEWKEIVAIYKFVMKEDMASE